MVTLFSCGLGTTLAGKMLVFLAMPCSAFPLFLLYEYVIHFSTTASSIRKGGRHLIKQPNNPSYEEPAGP